MTVARGAGAAAPVPSTRMERYFCADAAEAVDEPVTATASRVLRWLLVEQPGPWGHEAVPSTRGLDGATTRSLQATAQRAGARLLLLRRPRGTASPPGRRVLIADVRPPVRRLLERTVHDDAELLSLDLPWTGPPPPGWRAVDGPALLVCTHGKHDPCCAVRGRPVAEALARVAPEETWECSHVGGDRFAANVVVLPAGTYLGRVPPSAAAEVVAATRAGRVPLIWSRGSSRWTPVEQAAQHFAAVRLGLDGVDDLPVLSAEGVGPERWRVQLGGREVPVTVVVERTIEAAARLLTCHADGERRPPAFRLVELNV